MRKFLADLFKNVNNEAWDLARILSFLGFVAILTLAFYKVKHGQEVTLESLANSLSIYLVAGGIFIGAKDLAKAKATSG